MSAQNGNSKKHLKFAIVVAAATLAVGILAGALAAGQALNTALAQTTGNMQNTATSANSSSSNTLPSYHYPGNLQAPSSVSTAGTATTKVKPDKFSVTVGVETKGTTAHEAASANAGLMAK